MTTSTAAAPLSLDEREAVLGALADAHTYYRGQVDRSWVPDYLNRRNLYPELVPARLGHAPAGWTTTRDHLRRQGWNDTTLEHAGLVFRTTKGGLVDVFRDRLMVPLRTVDGTLVGFTGRAAPIVSADTPKYLNSPASSVFVKHDLLYGLHEAADAIRVGATPVIVEGPLDRLALNQAHHPLMVAGVAPCGTALSPHQAAALVRAVGPGRPIAVALNNDQAGRQATRRAWHTLRDAGADNLHHMALPPGKDPAELIRNGRGATLRDALTYAGPLAHAAADAALEKTGAHGVRDTDWQQSIGLVRQLFRDDLHQVAATQVASYIAHIADQTGLPADVITAAATDAIASGAAAGRPTSPRIRASRGPAPPSEYRVAPHVSTLRTR